jgi:hypothetical protein
MFPAIAQRELVRDRVESGRAASLARGSRIGGSKIRGFEISGQGIRAATFRAGRALFALCAGATVLIGCPLYSDDCDGRSDCASGFYCDQFSRRCQPVLGEPGCSRPAQCELGETCTPDFVCRPGSCDYHGCVTGYRCGVVDSAHTCVPAMSDAGPSDAAVPGDAGDASEGSGDGSLDAGATDASFAGDAAIDTVVD